MRDFIGDYFRVITGDTRSVDYSLYTPYINPSMLSLYHIFPLDCNHASAFKSSDAWMSRKPEDPSLEFRVLGLGFRV